MKAATDTAKAPLTFSCEMPAPVKIGGETPDPLCCAREVVPTVVPTVVARDEAPCTVSVVNTCSVNVVEALPPEYVSISMEMESVDSRDCSLVSTRIRVQLPGYLRIG
jgi:hypothetical protein